MGTVGSLPSPSPLPSKLNDATQISSEESKLSKDKFSCSDMVIDEIDSHTNSSLNSNINDNNKSNCRNSSRSRGSVPVAYGPIVVRLRKTLVPTLATGRRSKFMKLEGDAAIKREMRRRRNREAARKLKEKRTNIEQQLKQEISELEYKEQDLLSAIKNLTSYKEELEVQHRHIIYLQEKLVRTDSSTLKNIEYNRERIYQSVPIHHKHTDVKEEPRSPSPQWQLLFSI